MKFKLVEDMMSREDMIKEIIQLGGSHYHFNRFPDEQLYYILMKMRDNLEKQRKIKSEKPEKYINLNDYETDEDGYIHKDGLTFESPEEMIDYYSLDEDTEKIKDGKWVNRGKEGTHGTFKTKKEADSQRKAMFAGGFKG